MEPDGYDLTSFDMPQTVIRLMEERDRHLYINVPKLKTHSMGVNRSTERSSSNRAIQYLYG